MAGAPHGPAGQGLESGPSPPPQPGDMGRPGSAGPMAGQGYGELVALGWAEAGSWAMGRVGERSQGRGVRASEGCECPQGPDITN